MFKRKKQNANNSRVLLYSLKDEERGRLEVYQILEAHLTEQKHALLKSIMEREGIPASDSVVYDPSACSFIQQETA